RGLPGDGADQRRDACRHGDRIASSFRHRVHHQPGQERPRAALDPDHQQQHQRGEPGRLRLGHRRRAAADLAGADRDVPHARDEDVAMSAVAVAAAPSRSVRKKRPIRPARVALHAFLIAMVVVWLFPLAWATYISLRPLSDTIQHGYVSLPSNGLSLVNYQSAWTQADLPYYYLNTLVVVIPGVALTLLLASMVAFCCTQFSWKFNLTVLMIFTAGNLLPAQVIIIPLYFIYLHTPISTGSKRPITSALNNLQGEFVANFNVITSAAILACLPPIIVYILLQKQFIAGLTLGSTKG